MLKQFTVRDQRGYIAFYICEITPGVLRLTNAEWNKPLFIEKDELINAILKIDAGVKRTEKPAAEKQYV